MNIKNSIKKVALAGLAAGAITVAGLGLGSAQADEPGGFTPLWTWDEVRYLAQEEAGMQAWHADRWVSRQQVYYYNPNLLNYVNNPCYYYGYPYNYQYGYNYPYNYNYNYGYNYNYYGCYGYGYGNQFYYTTAFYANAAIVTAAGDVLGIPGQTVLAELTQNSTLTQIAANRGWGKQTFLANLNAQIQAQINSSVITQAVGNAALASLAGNIIDQPGLQPAMQGVPVAQLGGAVY